MTNNGAIINEDAYVSEEDPDESPEKDVLFRLDQIYINVFFCFLLTVQKIQTSRQTKDALFVYGDNYNITERGVVDIFVSIQTFRQTTQSRQMSFEKKLHFIIALSFDTLGTS